MPSASHKASSIRHAFRPTACIGLLLAAGFAPSSAHACATCGCTLSTDAATGYSTQSGWRINLDDTWIDQNSLRHGRGKATPQQVVEQPSDPSLGGGEIEKGTGNRYLNFTVAYRFDADWGVSAVLPYVSRDHTTYGEQQSPYTPAATAPDQVSSARVAGIGSLQAGTGSTDLIAGAYYYQPVSQNFDAFVNAQFQAAVSQRLDQPGADFRPGNLASLSFGLRYEAHANWVPQLQVNAFHKSADQGALADRPDTAGSVVYLSPGVSASLGRRMQVYAFVQLPVYSQLQGYQLFPRWTGTVGLSMAL